MNYERLIHMTNLCYRSNLRIGIRMEVRNEVNYRTIWKWNYLCHCRKWNGSHTAWVLKGDQQLGGLNEGDL